MHTKSLIRELESLGLKLAGDKPGWWYKTWDSVRVYVCAI